MPDLPRPLPPPIDPRTRQPINFVKELVRQELSRDRWIDVPEEVREAYCLWRLQAEAPSH